MPRYDVTLAEHVIVESGVAVTFRAAADLDFMTVHTPLLDLAMWARGLPARHEWPSARTASAAGALEG